MLDIQTNSTFQRSKLKLAQVDQKRPTFEWLNRSLDSANCLDSDGGQPKQKIWYFKKFNMHPFQISKVFLKLYLWIFNHLFTSSADCAMKKPTVLAGILELWKLLGQTFFCICLFGWQTLFPKQFSKILHDSVKFSDKKTFLHFVWTKKFQRPTCGLIEIFVSLPPSVAFTWHTNQWAKLHASLLGEMSFGQNHDCTW